VSTADGKSGLSPPGYLTVGLRVYSYVV